LSEPFIHAKQTCEIRDSDAEEGRMLMPGLARTSSGSFRFRFKANKGAPGKRPLRSVGTVVFPIQDYVVGQVENMSCYRTLLSLKG
jgi:hypothetical protein